MNGDELFNNTQQYLFLLDLMSFSGSAAATRPPLNRKCVQSEVKVEFSRWRNPRIDQNGSAWGKLSQ